MISGCNLHSSPWPQHRSIPGRVPSASIAVVCGYRLHHCPKFARSVSASPLSTRSTIQTPGRVPIIDPHLFSNDEAGSEMLSLTPSLVAALIYSPNQKCSSQRQRQANVLVLHHDPRLNTRIPRCCRLCLRACAVVFPRFKSGSDDDERSTHRPSMEARTLRPC